MQAPHWQRLLKQAFTDRDELLAYLNLRKQPIDLPAKASDRFGLLVPRGFAALMRKGDPTDPLLLQVLPSARESAATPGFGQDPVGDLQAQAVPGVLHKYRGRVLIMATGACAVHCRYCFRRHYPYAGQTASNSQWEGIVRYIQEHTDIQEVILSGGDPLMLPDDMLAERLAQLRAIPHLQRLRLHTRLPVVLPERITPRLMDLLSDAISPAILILHINHPRELSEALISSIQSLRAGKATLLNQSVLLRRVNDSVATLAALSEKMFAAGILPYYLHQLDRVEGSAHFEVPEVEANRLYRQLLRRLPGYLVPKLVRETAGEGSKIPISPN